MKFSNIPCDITVFEANDDSNLLSVKLRIVNIGKNLNKTKFSEESIKEAESTICNIPILGYLKYDDDDKVIDFDSHNIVTKIVQCSDGLQIEQRYLERPIGVVPSDTEITYEEYNGETYLCATGYVWKCYANEGYQLLLDSDEKSVSMEISVAEGETDSIDGYYDIKKFTFFGVTVLGDNVMPGIQGANITKYSHMQNYKKAIEDICNEIYKIKKENNVVANIKQEPVKKTQNQAFGLYVKNITDQTFNQLKTRTITKTDWWGDEYEARAYYFRDLVPSENIVVVESSENYEYFGIPYLVKDDTITLDFENKREYISEWKEKKGEDTTQVTFDLDRDSELKDIVLKKFSQTEIDMKEINSELEGLKAFKKSIDDAQYETEIKGILEDFSFEEEEIKTFKEKVLNREITKEEFQKELFALQGMKFVNQIKSKQNKKNFTKDDEDDDTFTKINNQASSSNEFDVYGGLGKKYL